MIFALSLMPLMGVTGLAVDFARATLLRNRLQVAADAAALASIAVKSPAALEAQKMAGDGVVAAGEADGRQIFYSNLNAADRAAVTSVTVKVEKVGNRLRSEVNFGVDSQTSLLAIFGQNSSSMKGRSAGEYMLAQFVDFHILIDNTPSMGVGATAADIAILEAKTGCAFACHDLSNANNAYKKAKSFGANMRIDVVRMAVKKLTETAGDNMEVDNQFRMGVYTFGDTALTMGLKTIISPTSDMKKVRDEANAVDLMSIPFNGFNNDQTTDFYSTLDKMEGKLTAAGDGNSSETPQKILFLVSDGVNDGFVPLTGCTKKLTGTRCQAPIDVAQSICKKIKAKGIKIAALYTTYLPLPSNGWYNDWIKPFQAELGAKMQECASPGLYYEVSPTEGIDDAMNALFKKSLRTVQLSS
nr:pilus assembly protein TadG-related protein [Aureimonas psammosilenae]